MTALALRAVRRLLAINAILVCALLPEVPFPVTLALVLMCFLETLVPAPVFCKEPAFQDAIAFVAYLTLPIFLFLYMSLGSGNPLLDALLSFLMIFHLKWVFAPRSDFHWLASIMLYALVGLRTSDLLFGLGFCSFIFLSLIYLVGVQEHGQGMGSRQRYLATVERRRQIRVNILRWTVPILLLGLLTYYFFPRFPPKKGWGPAGKYTNVTDSINLNDQGPLSLDPKVVAKISFLRGGIGPKDLYLRTGHLDAILEQNWSFYRVDQGYGDAPRFIPDRSRRSSSRDATLYWQFHHAARRPGPSDEVEYRMEIRDPEAEFTALALGTFAIQIPKPGRLLRRGSDFYLIDDLPAPYAIQGAAAYPEISSSGWKINPHIADRPLAWQERQFLTMLPEKLKGGMIRSVALVWAQKAPQRSERAVVKEIIDRFRRGQEFRYSLNPTIRHNSPNPIADFLLQPNYSEGYCEMFAAAAVVLLRNLGIPCRIGVGFTGSEATPEGELIVRRSNAHAWVEVYLKGEGWIGFDPTPPQIYRSYQGRESFKFIKNWMDNLQTKWTDIFINYDNVRQDTFFHAIGAFLFQLRKNTQEEIGETKGAFGWFSGRLSEYPVLRLLFILALFFMLVSLIFSLMFRRRRLRAVMKPVEFAGDFWHRVERILSRATTRRPESQTPRVYLDRLAQSGVIAAPLARQIGRHYEQLFYGLNAPRGEEKRIIASLRHQVKNQPR